MEGVGVLIMALIWDVVGSGVEARAFIAWSIWIWCFTGGSGIRVGVRVGMTGRVVTGFRFLGVTLLQSTFPNGKLSL